MKGIVLAGGSGTRLYPLTKVISKILLPVYDKPMVYYPLAVLMSAGIRDILIISNPNDVGRFSELLKDGNNFGINISYAVQPVPKGIADAFIIGERFIGNDAVALILGDNIFYGNELEDRLSNAMNRTKEDSSATVFGYYVNDPRRFGVVEFNELGKAVSIEEKPQHPKSNYCVTGLYFYSNDVVKYAKKLKPSNRGELEITDINKIYLKNNCLNVELLRKEFSWFDTGTYDSLADAADFIRITEHKTNKKIACLEEIAYQKGWINKTMIKEIYMDMSKSQYGEYILKLIE